MTPDSPEALRQTLVDKLGVIDEEVWRQAVEQTKSASGILDWLGKAIRCHLYNGALPLLTKYQIDAIRAGNQEKLILLVGGEAWLLLKPLPSGGQAEVFLASPRPCVKTAASLGVLKRPSKPASLGPLQNEIRILRGLHHPNIAELLASDLETGVAVTRFVNGPSLDAMLDQGRRLSILLTVQIGIQICKALVPLHADNKIHKDLKPPNILWGDNGLSVLIDFGLVEDPSAGPVQFRGTPHYIAPEVYFDDPGKVDARADVYGLAATLYCLLTGQPPRFQQCLDRVHYQSERARLDEARFRMLDSSLDCDVHRFRSDVPHQLSELIVQSLRFEPSQRPNNVSQLADSLRSIRQQIRRAAEVERECHLLADSLLRLYRQGNRPDFEVFDLARNAKALKGDLERKLASLTWLAEMKVRPLKLTGIGTDAALHCRTVALLEQLEFLCRSLGVVGLQPTDRRNKAAMVTALEGIRDASVLAFGIAHEWLTFLQKMGCQHLPIGKAADTEKQLTASI
jgi:serine/threonine protein kinase